MRQAERELDRYLTLLRNKIRQRGFTQLEVQESLGWGRSYISQLLTRQKNLRLDQVLMILNVIGATPEEFFAELHGLATPSSWPEASPERVQDAPFWRELERLREVLDGLVGLLVERRVIASSELRAAVEAVEERGG